MWLQLSDGWADWAVQTSSLKALRVGAGRQLAFCLHVMLCPQGGWPRLLHVMVLVVVLRQQEEEGGSLKDS